MEGKEQKLYEVRASNLGRILKQEFRGDFDEFCEHIRLKKLTVSKLLNPNSDRPCKDRAARRIESLLNRGQHTLDYEYSEQKEIYYVAIGTNTNFTYEVIRALKREESIKECSAVLGDFDILIKVEVESFLFLDILLATISRLPGVKRCQTYLSIKTLRWQREQAENMHLPPKNSKYYASNSIEKYIERKVNYHLDKIKELEKGEISIKDADNIPLEPRKILDGAKVSIKAIRTPNEDFKRFNDYVNCEKDLIREGVKSKRIILLPDDSYKEEWNKYKEDYSLFNKIGSNVKFLLVSEWAATPLSDFSEQFVIIDNNFVCVRREEQNRLIIKRGREMVDLYAESFTANWYRSHSILEIEEKIKKQSYQGFI